MKIKTKLILTILTISTLLSICSKSNAESIISHNNNDSIIISEKARTQNLNLYSESAILIDAKTGKILYGKNENQKMYPASTTKILTAILALEKCSLTDKITASYNAVMSLPAGYSNAAIQPNETLTLEELLNMFLIHSANEVGTIIAEHISGSVNDFSNLMNQKLSDIGCTNTHFTNPSGIHDNEHYSTAYDMATLAKYCMENNDFRNIVSKKSCTIAPTDKYEERYFTNTNDLIMPGSQYYYEYAIGIKTGYTSQAKNCLISASLKDGLELISVVLGAPSTETGKSGRNIDTVNLFEYGYQNYEIKEIVTQNKIIENTLVSKATKDTENLPVLLRDSIYSTIPINFDLNTLEYKIELNENLTAPIAKDSVVGTITYNIDGVSYTSDLLAGHDVEKSNILLLICQIILVIIILFILTKLLAPKKFYKKKKFKK